MFLVLFVFSVVRFWEAVTFQAFLLDQALLNPRLVTPFLMVGDSIGKGRLTAGVVFPEFVSITKRLFHMLKLVGRVGRTYFSGLKLR